MTHITYDHRDNFMIAFGQQLKCSCIVRNELNGLRGGNEVVYTIPNHKPYQPRIFPAGKWEVYAPVARQDPYEAPYFIPTNATLGVLIWELDENKHYFRATDKKDIDAAYGFHYSKIGRAHV